MLLPFNCIPPNVDYETNINVPRRVTVLPKTRQTKSVRSDTEIVSESDSEVSDQDETVLTTLRQPRHSGTEIPRFSISGGTPSSVDLSIDHSDRSIFYNETRDRAVSPPGSQYSAATSVDLTENNVSEDRTSPVVRRSSRQRAPPDKYGEWVHSHVVDKDCEVFV